LVEPPPPLWTWTASDGYPIAVASWPAIGPTRGRVLILHGVQSHHGWYVGLGRRLAEAGFESHLADRRGSGANTKDRGHAPSPGRLVEDVGELLGDLDAKAKGIPTALAGISWGGKLAVLASARYPERVGALALICPGMQPRVGVSRAERLRIALAYFTGRRRKRFPIPLADPALFTADPAGRAFIGSDPLSLREATAGLLAASTLIDFQVARVPPKVAQPVLLLLASEDRIVDNARTRVYVDRLASRDRTVVEYPGAHHTLEFEPDPGRYARDVAAWLSDRLARDS
jgi:acylglycerol lipase